MDYSLSNLANGLRVLTVPMPSLESATITVWVRTGSMFEDKKVNGISHFLEHMAFKGGKKYKNAKEVSEAVDNLGAINNAGTSKEWTNFWIKTSVSNLEKAFDILSDITLSPALSQVEIDKERGVIGEEIAMYEDTPMMSIGEDFETLIYSGTSLGWKISGDKETLKNINRPQFLEYRDAFYHADKMLLSVAGGVSGSQVEDLAKKYFSDVKGSVSKNDSPFKGVALQGGERVYLKTKKSDQAHLILGFPTEGRNYKGEFAQEVLTTILGRGMSSRLFTEVREKRGLAYAVKGFREEYLGTGEFGVYAGVTIEKIDEAIKVIMDEVYVIASKDKKIKDLELSKAKNYLKGKIALSLEDSSEVGDYFAEQALLDDKIYTPHEYFEEVDKVTIDDVYYEAGKIFDKNRAYLAIIGPYKDKKKFVKLLI
jgi:predicted Zn-dependent peptidase